MNNLKIKLLSVLFASTILVSCANNEVINLPEQNTSEIMATQVGQGSSFAKSKNSVLKIAEKANKSTSYKTESEAIASALELQKGIFSLADDYIILKSDNNYVIHNIELIENNRKTSTKLNSYADLRDFKPYSNTNAIAIMSKNGQVRFLQGQEDSNVYSKSTTIEQCVARLDVMKKSLGTNLDHRGIFATTYSVITRRVMNEVIKLKSAGDFKTAEFEEKLLINFANKYFDAYDNYTANKLDKVPEVWRAAFDSGRKSQARGLKKSGNIAEVLGLSMVAHIIHDLSFSLNEVGYDEKDPVLKNAYYSFNESLFDEKDNILKALRTSYGDNIVQQANDVFGSVGEFTMQKIFSIMRGMSAKQSQNFNPQEIVKTSVSVSDAVTKAVPGGNTIK